MSFFRNNGMFGGSFGSDTFFRDPFEQMERMMDSMMADPFGGGAAFGPMGAPFVAQRHHQQPQRVRDADLRRDPHYDSGPLIEEVEDEEEEEGVNAEPIVEEPGDEQAYRQSSERNNHQQDNYFQRYQTSNNTGNQYRSSSNINNNNNNGLSGMRMQVGPDGFPQINSFGNSRATTMFSYSSSYSSTGGPSGVVYSSTSSTRIGPGGVRETQTTVRDGRYGQACVTVSRGIGDRSRTITRSRNARGHEERQDVLQNIGINETDQFEREWNVQAQQSLPGGASQGLGSRRAGQTGGQPRLEYRGPWGHYP